MGVEFSKYCSWDCLWDVQNEKTVSAENLESPRREASFFTSLLSDRRLGTYMEDNTYMKRVTMPPFEHLEEASEGNKKVSMFCSQGIGSSAYASGEGWVRVLFMDAYE